MNRGRTLIEIRRDMTLKLSLLHHHILKYLLNVNNFKAVNVGE